VDQLTEIRSSGNESLEIRRPFEYRLIALGEAAGKAWFRLWGWVVYPISTDIGMRIYGVLAWIFMIAAWVSVYLLDVHPSQWAISDSVIKPVSMFVVYMGALAIIPPTVALGLAPGPYLIVFRYLDTHTIPCWTARGIAALSQVGWLVLAHVLLISEI